jgi:cellulose biosynthesis protein BcsQ
MYIVTFYSFKGGVGRTMAMANVGLSLAQEGRRVLLVDFDLEAPGLDTFDLLKPAEPALGLVDFVTEYRSTHAAPDVRKFVYEPSHPNLDANVWVMPTGKQDADYGARLNAIDWRQLYAEESGFLLFEDLKQQWARELNPDYVLIDSRTGHTDVGGICTRQLPNAVCLMFFPNEQNRRGLEVVVRDINRESRESGRAIELYPVAANVPDLDDEDSILRERISEFERTLERRPAATIHHYDSFSLLQQDVFTIQRPRTKLAREYRKLGQVITAQNLHDRSVVSQFLKNLGRDVYGPLKPEEIPARLSRIADLYSGDGAILFELAQANRVLGRSGDAERLSLEAEHLGFLSEERFAEKAAVEYAAGAIEVARQLVRRALELTTMRVLALIHLFCTVVEKDVTFLPKVFAVLDAKGIEPDDRLYVANQLAVRREALPAIVEFLRPLSRSDEPGNALARSEIAVCLIGLRQFGEAKSVILSGGRLISELSMQDSFNYAVADWGETGQVPVNLFTRVAALDVEAPPQRPAANYLQCLALANWAAGRSDAARQLLSKSRSPLSGQHNSEFSAWSYLRVSRAEFLADLDSLDALISTGVGQPAIFNERP